MSKALLTIVADANLAQFIADAVRKEFSFDPEVTKDQSTGNFKVFGEDHSEGYRRTQVAVFVSGLFHGIGIASRLDPAVFSQFAGL